MKLIVGLGNPGDEYLNTRHNMGFMVIDNYASQNNIMPKDFHSKFDGLYVKTYINNEPVILLKPMLYMNLSGIVVSKYVNYFHIDPSDILIIHDDLDLNMGKMKIKFGGSSGGHNGIKNIIQELKTDQYAHFKIGIGKDNNQEIKDYVLSKFSDSDFHSLEKILLISKNVINDFVQLDISRLMNKYNGENYEIE